MFPTVEVRWFYRGTIPPEIAAWFEQGKQVQDDLGVRTDYYLRLPGDDVLSVKLREGRIEVKQRQRDYGIERFHERVAGLVERWYKWSFVVAGQNGGLAERLFPAHLWIAVRKKRRLRRFRLDADHQLEILSATGLPIQGCDLELTNLQSGQETWWSLCFESFGPEETLHRNLAFVAWHTMTRHQPPLLQAQDSYSYPRWLQRLKDGLEKNKDSPGPGVNIQDKESSEDGDLGMP